MYNLRTASATTGIMCVRLKWQHVCVALDALDSNTSREWQHVCVALSRLSAARLAATWLLQSILIQSVIYSIV
jgi:hypothetical protein